MESEDPKANSEESKAEVSNTSVHRAWSYHFWGWVVLIFIGFIPNSHGEYSRSMYIIFSVSSMLVFYLCCREKKVNPNGISILFLFALSILYCVSLAVIGYARMHRYFSFNLRLGVNNSLILIIGIVILIVAVYIFIRKKISNDAQPKEAAE